MTLYELPVLVFLFALGACLGSFLNVCIYRIPQHESLGASLKGLWGPASYCPRCSTPIRWFDNIPIFGWLRLGGRCRSCRGRISIRYPLIELFNGLLFVVVYRFEVPPWIYHFRLEDSGLYSELWRQSLTAPDWLPPWALLHLRYAYHMVLLQALLVATFIDIDLKIIPDGVTLPAMAFGAVLGATGLVYLVPVWFQDPAELRSLQIITPEWMHGLMAGDRYPDWIFEYPRLHGLAVSLAGLVVGGGVIWAVRLIGHWVLKQEAMGFGDVVLMAMIGSFLGWQPTLIVFFLAPVCALAVVLVGLFFRRSREIPYGPYLSLATLIVILGWSTIWPPAQRIFQLGPLLLFPAIFMTVGLFASLQLIQAFKRAIGISLDPPLEDEWIEEWTSADQLTHFVGENVDSHQGRWRIEEWPGAAAGRGTAGDQNWRRGQANAWQQGWIRRGNNGH
jgi:leader peptidase (prepilin peptidase) / N-methyltransferase